MSTPTGADLLWPARYERPEDVLEIETVPLAERGLPGSTYDVLCRAAALWPDRVAMSVLPAAESWQAYSTVTFAQLGARTNALANALHALGVRRGDAVGLLSPNCEELTIATLAAQAAGIAAPVNPALDVAHVRELLARSGARVLIAAGPELDAGVWNTALDLARSESLDAVLALRPTGASGPPSELPAADGLVVAYASEQSRMQPSDQFLGLAPTASDLAAVFHTGGTTGVPKLAAHTHANEVIDAWMIAANTLLNEDSVVFAALPLFHVNAVVVTLLSPLLRGQRVVWAGPQGYRDPAIYQQFWRIVEHFRIASMSAVPTVYQVLAHMPVDADISSMRLALVGAAPLPTAVRDAFQQNTGIRLMEGYGLTEATCASIRGFTNSTPAGSVGGRLPYQRLKVIRRRADGTWQDLPTGEVGVLAINGPTVFPGYVVSHNGQRASVDGAGTLVDGWLDTGDLARIDACGFVYLTGREKDLIIRGGHNIDPAVVEEALLSHPQVTGAAAVGRPDAHSVEVPIAYVTVAADAAVTPAELMLWAAERVPEAAAAPKGVLIRDSLPVTAVGKPNKLPLRAEAAHDVIATALKGLTHITDVQALIEDGSVVVIVSAEPGVSRMALDRALGAYAVRWRLEISS